MSVVQNLNYWAIGGAAALAFIVGALWNSPLLFGEARIELAGLDPESAMSPAAALAEFVRCLVVASVLALVLKISGVAALLPALGFAALIWLGFQAALLSGAVIWEGMAPRLYAIHAGDALIKILLMTATLTLWSR